MSEVSKHVHPVLYSNSLPGSGPVVGLDSARDVLVSGAMAVIRAAGMGGCKFSLQLSVSLQHNVELYSTSIPVSKQISLACPGMVSSNWG